MNHNRLCNLRCIYCGYQNNDQLETDTSHYLILSAIQTCIDNAICCSKLFL